MNIKSAINYRDQIAALLSAENLPVNDLPHNLDSFVVAVEDGTVKGAAGIEIYGSYGLLRSVITVISSRGKGVATKLTAHLEELAQDKGLTALYLLTETAPDYFSKIGYSIINRNEVPAEVQQSSEFSHVCPISAIVMKKTI